MFSGIPEHTLTPLTICIQFPRPHRTKCPISLVKHPCEWYTQTLPLSKSLPFSLSPNSPHHSHPLRNRIQSDWWVEGSHLDLEKSGQFNGCYCILNATGVKETDEAGDGRSSSGDPPSWLLVQNPIGRMGRVEGGGTGNKSAWRRESIASPSLPALSHLQGLREAERFKRSWPCPT